MRDDAAPLLGQAIADALGMPFETLLADDPVLKGWDGVTYLPSEHHHLRPGQWTDDTMMAKLLAESLSQRGHYDPEDVSQRYLAWYRSGCLRGIGGATKKALAALEAGKDWSTSGVEEAQGNGTAMRAVPLGVYFRDHVSTLIEAAVIDAHITHRSEEAAQGSVAIALAAAYLSRSGPKQHLPEAISGRLKDGPIKLGVLKCEFYLRAGGVSVAEALRVIGTRAHVLETVPAALAAFLLTDSYLEAVQAAIRAGGDTDTTAAIAGALAGIYYGREGIPPRFLKGLESIDSFYQLDFQLQHRPGSKFSSAEE